MDDLISRKALLEKMNDTKIQIMFDLPVEELLGEDVDMDDFCTLLQDAIQAYKKLVIGQVINKTPTVEAVSVVHCKNCEHWGTGVAGETEHVKCCEYGKYMVGKNGYCCYADMRKKVQDGRPY